MANEYIRKQDVSDWLKQYGQDVLHGKYKFSLMYIWKNLMDLPSADVVPVLHGAWEHHISFGVCDKCGYEYNWTGTDAKNFCPNCGAKMDGGKED